MKKVLGKKRKRMYWLQIYDQLSFRRRVRIRIRIRTFLCQVQDKVVEIRKKVIDVEDYRTVKESFKK